MPFYDRLKMGHSDPIEEVGEPFFALSAHLKILCEITDQVGQRSRRDLTGEYAEPGTVTIAAAAQCYPVGRHEPTGVALGNTGGPGAVEALVRAMEDPSPVVREHAGWALERLEGAGAGSG